MTDAVVDTPDQQVEAQPQLGTRTAEVVVAAKTALSIDPEQSAFTDPQMAALRQLGIQDAGQGDLMLFFHQAKRTGLDPFSRQIYMIGRKTKTGGYRGEPERWETKWTIQTAIDGYRLNARRAASRGGDSITLEGPYWRGASRDEPWDDVWLDPTKPPAAAKYTVIRNGEAFTGVAMYAEYVQTTGYGDNAKPNTMWAKMPANQLAKCAESQAWRKAYPHDFSGLVLEDAAQVIDSDGNVLNEQPARRPVAGRGVGGLMDAIKDRQQEPTPPQVAAEPVELNSLGEPAATKAQFRRINPLMRVRFDSAEAAAEFATQVVGRAITTLSDLSEVEAAKLTASLAALDNPQRAPIPECDPQDAAPGGGDDAPPPGSGHDEPAQVAPPPVEADTPQEDSSRGTSRASREQLKRVAELLDAEKLGGGKARLEYAGQIIGRPDLAALGDLSAADVDEIVLVLTATPTKEKK